MGLQLDESMDAANYLSMSASQHCTAGAEMAVERRAVWHNERKRINAKGVTVSTPSVRQNKPKSDGLVGQEQAGDCWVAFPSPRHHNEWPEIC